MVRLRLRRKGRTHHAIYDIVVMDGRSRRDGAFIERLGYYDPHTKPATVKINHERSVYWLSVGAQPTDVLEKIMSYEGILLRKHLALKGKSAEEIEAEVVKHKEVTTARYLRRKELRKIRKANKLKAEEEAKAAEQKAKE